MKHTVASCRVKLSSMRAIILSVLAASLVCNAVETYDPKFDNIDAQVLVDDIFLLKNYGKCFLNKGPCTPEAREIRKIIPDAIKTTCAKCSPKQRQLIRVVVKGFQTKLPEMWKDLEDKIDPTKEYRPAFAEFLKRSD
ncbi:ejaculatory bulb-specific protein 3-like [Leptidea sinapis]|uniref:ejaculatory bulb-specific protein 3-like n=1 Tax=Leptidea sinapis TaxID=189913 RepID=UPI0021469084|nr:ejaculatory bulb-specific protein 3-like [Leptidea sinapis]